MQVFQFVLFLLAALTSLACMGLLFRGYARTRAPLLLWSALCFALLALNNLFVVIDLLILPSMDLVPFRHLASLAAVSVLLFGFIWETQ